MVQHGEEGKERRIQTPYGTDLLNRLIGSGDELAVRPPRSSGDDTPASGTGLGLVGCSSLSCSHSNSLAKIFPLNNLA